MKFLLLFLGQKESEKSSFKSWKKS